MNIGKYLFKAFNAILYGENGEIHSGSIKHFASNDVKMIIYLV